MSSENICRIFASPKRRPLRDQELVQPAMHELGPRAGPGVQTGIQCGITYLDRVSDVHVPFYALVPGRGPGPRSGS